MSEAFEAHRGRLTGLAYRMLGSLADAEDIVQDAWVKRQSARDVANEEAFLVTIVTRLCLDRLKSARARREIYVGPWLPEPVLDADALSPHAATELADDLSFALMLTLERLSPLERAAFLLHDVFDESFADVAEALGRSEEACRQLASRARKAVKDARPAREAAPEMHERLLAAFAQAAANGDVSALKAMLTEDAVALTDGGGIRTAALNPIRGADKVARFIIGLARKYAERSGDFALRPTTINGSPGFLVFIEGALDQTLSIAVEGGRIAALYGVRNPEKLALIRGS
ncbi:MAG: sigma-70 family RNA polymerase sigma factor [Hyphomonadaceae bacterium]